MLLPVQYTGDTGKATAAAGTPIKALIPPKRASKTRLAEIRYTPGTTAHTLTVMRPLANVKAVLAALAGQAIVILTVDPGTLLVPARPLAANDWVVLEGPTQNGLPTFILAQVAAVTAGPAIPAPAGGQPQGQPAYPNTLQVTLTANLPTGGVVQWAKVWMLGQTTDGHPQFNLPASATADITNIAVGVVGSRGLYEPLVIWVDNITAAGQLENAVIAYTAEQNYGQTAFLAGRAEGVAGGGRGEGVGEETPDPTLDAVTVLCVPKGEHEAILAGRAEKAGLAAPPDHWKLPDWPGFAEEPRYYIGHPGDPDWRHPDAGPPPEAGAAAPPAAAGGGEGVRLDAGLPGA